MLMCCHSRQFSAEHGSVLTPSLILQIPSCRAEIDTSSAIPPLLAIVCFTPSRSSLAQCARTLALLVDPMDAKVVQAFKVSPYPLFVPTNVN